MPANVTSCSGADCCDEEQGAFDNSAQSGLVRLPAVPIDGDLELAHIGAMHCTTLDPRTFAVYALGPLPSELDYYIVRGEAEVFLAERGVARDDAYFIVASDGSRNGWLAVRRGLPERMLLD